MATHDDDISIRPYCATDQAAIRAILSAIGWEEHYIAGIEQAAVALAARDDAAVYCAWRDQLPLGFVLVELHGWNRLAQLQGLAVAPAAQRQGVASALVAQAEAFARGLGARGIYVDTPVDNARGRRFYEAMSYRAAYVMPRYYDDALDGVTYQKFFDDDAH
jgi:ribosomal protein S18 acetylase RimI-like enzyme